MAGIVVFLIGLFVGGAIIYGLHKKHWLGDQDRREPRAFSEVGVDKAGELAERFRPWLRFDSREQWRPLNITRFFAEASVTGRGHEFCTRPPAKPGCESIAGEDEFQRDAERVSALGDASYIDIAGDRKEDYRGPGTCKTLDCGTGPGSAIYYHAVESNDRFYIDYWWFLRFNNFELSAPKLSCKSQAAREQEICGEHEGDWEGVTVVTPPGDDQRIDYVVYAAHTGAFRYAPNEQGVRVRDGTRPVVFVARGSHASYPKACTESVCDQPIVLQGLVTLPENRFDGGSDWERNGEDCKADAPDSCLLSLPRVDHNPQAWTVWPGLWGAGCGAVCGGEPGGGSPKSPGVQPRYQTPWCSAQQGVTTCDGRALSCSDWLGPLVTAVVCDPDRLAAGLRRSEETGTGNLALTVRGEERTTEATPGVVQALGDPLTPGCTVTVSGTSPNAQILVRAQQDNSLVEARFDKLGLTQGGTAIVSIKRGANAPRIQLRGRKPVERRIFLTESPPKQATAC